MWSRIVVLSGAILGVGFIGPALAEDSLEDALKNGEVLLDMRYRYEFVDDDMFTEDAKASTLRTRLGYKTGNYHDFFVLGEFQDVTIIGSDRYNSTANGKIQFPIVADPDETEVNQAYLGYTGVKGTSFLLGRQRINLDNQRFVGSVAWRQLEQTFDAFTAGGNFHEKWNFFYGHLNNANRVNGEHNPNPALADVGLDSDLGNLSYEFSFGTLIGYGYFFEFTDSPTAALASQQTIGIRFTGKHSFSDDYTLLYTGEYADQSDYQDGSSIIDAGYQLVELGLQAKKITYKIGWELLEGDGVYGFQTPFATLHAHNGWADKFLVTPREGLEDLYFSVGAKVAGIRLLGIYHDFSSDFGGIDYGTELDLLATRKFKEMYTVGIKFASYDGENAATIPIPPLTGTDLDTEKIWLWLQLKF